MKKLYILSVFLFSVPELASSQSIPSNTERYGVDYIVKGWTKIDTAVAIQINLAQFENLKKDDEDVEVYSASDDLTLVLFSKIKTIENESKQKNQSSYFRDLYFREP